MLNKSCIQAALNNEHTRRPNENRVVMFADEVAGGEVIDPFSLHRFIKVEVEIVEAFLISKGGRFGETFDLPITADHHLIFEDEF